MNDFIRVRQINNLAHDGCINKNRKLLRSTVILFKTDILKQFSNDQEIIGHAHGVADKFSTTVRP
jgi:hypothetical protein